MSEQIREQVSAFLDGELPNSETELLLKRLTRDVELRESFGRYALIGESLRGGGHGRLTQGFTVRVNRAIDGDAGVPNLHSAASRSVGWWRPLAGAAVAAGVAAVAFVSFQQRAIAPSVSGAATTVQAMPAGAAVPGQEAVRGPAAVRNASLSTQESAAKPTEALSYTVPAALAEAPRALPAARLTNYVFAHSKYSAVMGQNDVLNDLLSYSDTDDTAAVRGSPGAAAPGAASRDARVAP